MNAIVIREFTRRGEFQKIGKVIEVTPEALSLLSEYVVVFSTEEELMDMIRHADVELNRVRDWTGWRQSLSVSELKRIREVEGLVDSTFGALDRQGLAQALADYALLVMGTVH